MEIKSATSNKKPSPPITTKGTTTASSTAGKALKLGAVKMTHRQTQQQSLNFFLKNFFENIKKKFNEIFRNFKKKFLKP